MKALRYLLNYLYGCIYFRYKMKTKNIRKLELGKDLTHIY